MASLNKVMLIGRLGQDPECKEVTNGLVANFTIATNEYWNDKQGQKQESTEWHKIVVWGKQAELAQSFLKKGSQVYVEGKNQTSSWETQTGETRYKTEVSVHKIQFLDSKQSDGETQTKHDIMDYAPKQPAAATQPHKNQMGDDIPF
ncbi:MAG: single-stranded DNA-binding protein [Nitrospina sp.]|jgi:single-strand DNA-binding protein|nr:single-stranded DNA-binding protein [Nitrospina sp.]